MVIHWSFSDSKSSQVSRTLLSILAVLSNAVIWLVSTHPPTFIIIIIIIPCQFYTPAEADGISLDSEWQQVSSGLYIITIVIVGNNCPRAPLVV